MPYRQKKHSAPKPASKLKTPHNYLVELGKPAYTPTRSYHIQAENAWEAAKKALAKTGAKKCSFKRPFCEGEQDIFVITIYDKDQDHG